MSDARRRLLERAAAGGDPGAAARGLAEEVRRGALAPAHLRLAAYLGDERAVAALGSDTPDAAGAAALLVQLLDERRLTAAGLRVAAHLGDPAARRAVEHEADPRPPEAVPLRSWALDGALLAEREVMARVAAEAARAVVGRAARAGEGVLALLDAVDAWVGCPCPDHAEAAAAARRSGQAALGELDGRPRHALLAALAAAAVASNVPQVAAEGLLDALWYSMEASTREEVHAALRAALLPWAFGLPAGLGVPE